MAKKQRKTSSKKTKKTKRHLNISIVFLSIICILSAITIWHFYQYEQQKIEYHTIPPNKKVTVKTRTSPGKEQSKQKQKRQNAQASQIVEYTDLEYPISYSIRPEQILFHTGHTISYNSTWKLPNWVSYTLTRNKTTGTEIRYDKFSRDPQVTGRTATNADYRRSGYDKGHMAPAADMKWNADAMKESFYFSNICPQHPGLNRRIWKKLESKVRDWATTDSIIIVICGPLVNQSPQTIGSNNIAVPDGFFKVILSPHANPPQAIGFIFKNENSLHSLRMHAVTIDSVEIVSGFDFFSTLPDKTEESIEAHIDLLYWGI